MDPGQQAATNRMSGIDAARGAAMLFSCLAHYGWWIEGVHPLAEHLLTTIGMIATPTFLLLSGTITGWLCATASKNPRRTRLKLLNRGLFLLTFGHLLISLAEAHRSGSLLRTIAGATIIDDIGLCMLLCAAYFSALQRPEIRRGLVGYGIAGYVACWTLILTWHTSASGWLMLRQALLGSDPLGPVMNSYASPTLPYACLFAVGLGISDRMVAIAREENASRRWNLIAIGVGLVFCALLCHLLRVVLDHALGVTGTSRLIDAPLTVGGKLPPAPAYVLAYGGAGLVLCGVFFQMASSRFRPARQVASVAAVVGKASLFVFVLQYFIYWTLPDLVGVTPEDRHVVLIFLAGLGINWFAARGWNQINGNRFLTLGIGGWGGASRTTPGPISTHPSGR